MGDIVLVGRNRNNVSVALIRVLLLENILLGFELRRVVGLMLIIVGAESLRLDVLVLLFIEVIVAANKIWMMNREYFN